MSKLLIVVDYQKDFVDGALGFAGAEARHPDAPALLPVGLLNGSLELPGAYLHGESDHALFQFFTAFHTHFIFPPFTVAV